MRWEEVGIRLRKPCSKVLNNLVMRRDTDINITVMDSSNYTNNTHE